MLVRLSPLLLILSASGGFMSGCRTTQSPDGAAAAAPAEARGRNRPADSRSIQEISEAHAHYAAAVVCELNGDGDGALKEYSAAALKDAGNESLVLEVSRRLVQNRQPEAALEVLTHATSRPDAAASVYAQLGIVYSRLGKYDQAINACRAAIRKQPRLLDGYRNLFVIQLQSQKSPDALAVLDEAGKVPQAPPEFLIGLAELYVNFGMQIPPQRPAVFGKALAVLQRLGNTDSLEPPLRLKLADLFNVLGKNTEAAAIYLDLIKSTADSPMLRETIRTKLTELYIRGSDRTQAVEQLEAMVRDNPTDAQAFYLLGGLAAESKNYSRAIEAFSQTLLLVPNFEPAYFDLAQAQINANKNGDALSTLDRYRRKFPEHSRNFLTEYLMAISYSHQKDFTNAINHFTEAEINAEATDTNKLDEEFYFQFGAASEQKGDFDQAVRYFERCLLLSPESAEAQNYLGYMWAERGENLPKARELIEKAVKADPKNPAYLDSMGWVLYKSNRSQEALDYLLRAVQLSEEEDATIYDHLGDVYQALGRLDKAREAWSKSVSLEPNDKVRKKLDSATK